MSGEVVTRFCTLCGSAFEQELRQGRPRVLCPSCAAPEKAAERVKAKQRAYYQREDVKAKKRAYYQREDVKAKKRAYRQRHAAAIAEGTVIPKSRWQCSECGEQLRRETEDGLCGFCRQGIPASGEIAA